MTNAQLPEWLERRIQQEAEQIFPISRYNEEILNHRIYIDRENYVKAVEPYASLALALKDALERISSLSDEYPIQVAIDLADAALKLFPEQGKEGV